MIRSRSRCSAYDLVVLLIHSESMRRSLCLRDSAHGRGSCDRDLERAWIRTPAAHGISEKGRHSVGVARQCSGQLGKQDNCQVAVSPPIANAHASLPAAYSFYYIVGVKSTNAGEDRRGQRQGADAHERREAGARSRRRGIAHISLARRHEREAQGIRLIS